ncbi:hypothetical protein CDCA_CDCA09G2827 [Cyanidium caldarium]|uniref:HotDog ACOT-type domain-containing protein n=1 Tax=Cyanidium caldarium TaxID=2771 RepID=A0AAV9IWX3_CYACA|nr:hypothetical protein CDCA_CDCA09G2827 [Cyanidium caldarium]
MACPWRQALVRSVAKRLTSAEPIGSTCQSIFFHLPSTRTFHARLQDAVSARAAAFPLYNASSVVEFLENEQVLSPLFPSRDVYCGSATTSEEGASSRTLRPPQYFRTRLQLSTSPALRAFYANSRGTLRVGRVFEDIDALAGSVALRHVARPNVNTVTAAVDRIRILPVRPVGDDSRHAGSTSAWWSLHSDLVYTARLHHVGRTSMSVACEVARAETGEQAFLEASFLFVARDAAGRTSVPVPGLLLRTEEERARFAEGERKAAARRERRPKAMASADDNDNNNAVAADGTPIANHHTANIDAPIRDGISIGDTALHTVHLVQPDERNLFGFMFGGTILRWALELAYLNVVRYATLPMGLVSSAADLELQRSLSPNLRAVGDITFHRSVPIGSLFQMKSRIVAVRQRHVAVRLSTSVWAPSSIAEATAHDTDTISNTMTFVFDVPALDDGVDAACEPRLRPVFPVTYEHMREHHHAQHLLEEVR